MKKIIYVTRGDLLTFRYMDDPDDDKTASAWNSQVRPRSIHVKIMGSRHIQVSDPYLDISETKAFSLEIKRYR